MFVLDESDNSAAVAPKPVAAAAPKPKPALVSTTFTSHTFTNVTLSLHKGSLHDFKVRYSYITAGKHRFDCCYNADCVLICDAVYIVDRKMYLLFTNNLFTCRRAPSCAPWLMMTSPCVMLVQWARPFTKSVVTHLTRYLILTTTCL